MNRMDASIDVDGFFRAGPFVSPVPESLRVGAAGTLVAGIRPEDLVLERSGDGLPCTIEHDIDLRHYRRVSLRVEGVSLLAFVPKSDPLPTDSPTVRPTRVLLYADGRLAGVSDLSPTAVDRTTQMQAAVGPRRSVRGAESGPHEEHPGAAANTLAPAGHLTRH